MSDTAVSKARVVTLDVGGRRCTLVSVSSPDAPVVTLRPVAGDVVSERLCASVLPGAGAEMSWSSHDTAFRAQVRVRTVSSKVMVVDVADVCRTQRRETARATLSAAVSLFAVGPAGPVTVSSRTKDLSVGGAAVWVPSDAVVAVRSLPQWAIRLTVPGGVVRAVVRVVEVVDEQRPFMRVEFTQMASADRKVLSVAVHGELLREQRRSR